MARIANAKHLFLMVKEQSEQSNVTSMLKNIFVIMLQNWNGPLVLKCLITLKKFFKTLLWRNGKLECRMSLQPIKQWSTSIKPLKNVFWNTWLHLPKIA
jgi:hypothetical protein